MHSSPSPPSGFADAEWVVDDITVRVQHPRMLGPRRRIVRGNVTQWSWTHVLRAKGFLRCDRLRIDDVATVETVGRDGRLGSVLQVEYDNRYPTTPEAAPGETYGR